METNEVRVYFALFGDEFDPKGVTDIIGVQPTSIMVKGSKIPGKVPVGSGWFYSSENIKQDSIDVFEMAKNISDFLEPSKEKIIRAINKFDLSPRLEVVMWLSNDDSVSTPALGFEPETIKFLSDVGAFIDIDSYKHES